MTRLVNPIFCKDPSLSYQNVFFLGCDFAILIWNIVIYQIFDIIVGNTLIALGLTYIFEKLLVWLREHFGGKNLSHKTSVDEAFLL